MADDKNNPFDTADDLNPFQVQDYNPFANPNAQVGVSPPAIHQIPLDGGIAPRPDPIPPPQFGPPGYYGTQGTPSSHPSLNDDPFTSEHVDLDDHTTGLMSQPQSFSTSSGARVTISQEKKDDDKEYSFYQIQFYQAFFNVDSTDVAVRCVRAMWPFKNDFLEATKNNPDFYGPFWITTTLIFMMAASGNFAAYLGVNSGSWSYDIMKLTYGAAVIYGYSLLVPLALWFYLRWIQINVRFIEILSIYGYSLFIYLPVSVLSIIPLNIAKWIVVGIGLFFSTGFLIVNLWMPLRGRLGYAIITLLVLAALHAALALTFRLYFFCYTALGDTNLTCT